MKRFLAGVSLFTIELCAQFPGASSQRALRGQVVSDQPFAETFTVELNTTGVAQIAALKSYTSPNGDFQIDGVSDGNYQLTLSDQQGRVIERQLVHVDSSQSSVEVRLPSYKDDAPPSGSVTLAGLTHKVPRKAQNELKTAEEARSRGDRQKSILHSEKALRLDPDFAAAHNDLATDYIVLKQFDRALAELDQAAKLDPAAWVVPMNQAVCLMQIGRFEEAEKAARRAVQLNGTSPRTRYALGLVLANERKFTPEAIDNLLRASSEAPTARLVVAQIFVDKGRIPDAREQLRLYLDGCSGERCKVVQNSLARLEHAGDGSK
jgi:tetratricopeptide (TPR) repeat protein